MAEPAELDRRTRRKLELRERMLESAVALFDERGVPRPRSRRSASARTSRRRPSSTTSRRSGSCCASSPRRRRSSCSSTSRRRARTRQDHARAPRALLRRHRRTRRARWPDAPRAAHRDHPRDRTSRAPSPSRRGGCTPPSARSCATASPPATSRAADAPETLTEMLLGAYYALMFNWANLDGLPDPRSAPRAARFLLADALAREGLTMAKREDEHVQLSDPERLVRGRLEPRPASPATCARSSYFGEELVLFRTRSGQARVLDAVLPAPRRAPRPRRPRDGRDGALPLPRLAVRRQTGACAHIPYCERIPPTARVRAWDVQEKNGMVFVWHHSEGKPPEWDFPAMPEIGHPDWSEPRTLRAGARSARPGHAREQQRPGALPVRAQDARDAARRDQLHGRRPSLPHASTATSR